MLHFRTDAAEWAQLHFGGADLGDVRRTRRLVHVASAFAADPAGSIPALSESWAATKAAYNLFDRPEVTFDSVCAPHFDLRRHCGPGLKLILSDTTEIDLGKKRRVEGMGPLGNGSGRGLLLHSGLLIDPVEGHLLGMAGALLLKRQNAPKKESTAKKLKRERESERWGHLIDRIGPPPENTTWVHVMDRESDNFEAFCHCQEQRTDWVSRARTLTRKVHAPGQPAKLLGLRDYLKTLPVAGTYELEVPAKARTRREPARQARTARMEVRYAKVVVPRPRQVSAYVKRRGVKEIEMGVVWVREIDPPAGQERIEWVLYTSLALPDLAAALEVVKHYKWRWWIEEWHKAIKTGTRIKARQLKKRERWEPLIGVSAVEAVRLLQLKCLARSKPEMLAEEVVPPRYVETLASVQKVASGQKMTVQGFWRGVARLGGFLGRKSDGEPGWQTIWHGWEKLSLMVRGVCAHLDNRNAPTDSDRDSDYANFETISKRTG
jgi:hypothetical protein